MSFERKLRRQRQQENQRAFNRNLRTAQLKEKQEMSEEREMPYPNVPQGQTNKMHDCVKKVMADGTQDEKTAIAICYSSIVKGAKPEDIQAEFHLEAPLDLSEFNESPPSTPETAKPPLASQRGEMVELSIGNSLADTITIQVLRAGAFVDMSGREIEIDTKVLDDFVSNSNAELAKRELPVDLGHPTDPAAPAAAWYREFFKQSVNGIDWICAKVELSALGIKSLSDKLYKYFSAALDLNKKSIIGGGFVNRPAVSGQQPIGALSEYLQPKIKGGEKQMDEKEMEAKLAAARDEERKRVLAEQGDVEAKLAEARTQERARVLAELTREKEIVTLAEELTRGNKALWHKPADLVVLLGKLTDDDRKIVGDLLKEIQVKGLVDLTEHGSALDGGTKKELPGLLKPVLAKWIAGGSTVEAFFATNPELGDAAQYDLKEFKK